jgi:hypothetical protein
MHNIHNKNVCEVCKGNDYYTNSKGDIQNCYLCTSETGSGNVSFTLQNESNTNPNNDDGGDMSVECLVSVQLTTEYLHKLTLNEKPTALSDFQKLVKSFKGSYILRKSYLVNSKFHSFAIINFPTLTALKGYETSLSISGYVTKYQLDILKDISFLEEATITAKNVINFA